MLGILNLTETQNNKKKNGKKIGTWIFDCVNQC